jgi:hypothetical protein
MYKVNLNNGSGSVGVEVLTPGQLEQQMTTEEDYKRYFYSLYRCSPDEKSDFNYRRNAIKEKYPDLVISFGKYFSLQGVAAYEILSSFYYSLSLIEEYDQETQDYYFNRYEEVKDAHESSQSLPFPINLTEGQLGTDHKFNFYLKEMLVNRQLLIELIDTRLTATAKH